MYTINPVSNFSEILYESIIGQDKNIKQREKQYHQKTQQNDLHKNRRAGDQQFFINCLYSLL
jgi:hypothetical protein